MLEEEEKKYKYWLLTKLLWKRIFSNKQNNSYDIISMEKWFFNTNNWMKPLYDENKLQFDE